ncbi:Rrf2 family transcriptional regulator [Salipaludibacillus sp. LMS25]|jgi:DNA-binding IscR family transcriptional regulator|uniref:Rrf2 family transcriptional regulator n=1 Tax=Salipaludibacillus sp. LMS25 TaxID=2924031 RepID=UPI0020D12171|nr:Rrf2 family transcriptional regulator [Salipaludibacillus sp. LMS25]UTR13219.1 Rrf2 family transcriptional regulator [Salipaludibacillus sp. LMS25]
MINTRLSVAIHILALIATQQGKALSSDFIAGSVNTNPVVVRRLSSLLKKAGILTSKPGQPGAKLIKEPENISLLDVYKAVQTHDDLFSIHEKPNPRCDIGSRIQVTLDTTFVRVQQAMEQELANQTLGDILNDLSNT